MMNGPADAENALRGQLAVIEERLVGELGDRLPAETIRQVVQGQIGRYQKAPVTQFIPVLVDRAAREQLLRQDARRQAG